METVGVFLRKEREAKNISLSEVSRQTKISKFYLDYIENDDYEKLPQGPYIKGYISSYSKLIGTDVQEALKLYDSLKNKGKPSETRPPDIPRRTDRKIPAPKPESNQLKQSSTALAGKLSSSFNAAATAVKAKSAALKAAAPPVNTFLNPFKKVFTSVAAGTQKMKPAAASTGRRVNSKMKDAGAWVSAIGPWTQKTLGAAIKNATLAMKAKGRLPSRRFWLVGTTALASGCILVLASFGVYHLLFFDKSQIIATQPQPPPSKQPSRQIVLKKPSPASSMVAIKERLPSIPKSAFAASQAIKAQEKRASAIPTSQLATKKNPEAKQLAIVPDNAESGDNKKILASAPPTQGSETAVVNVSVLKASVGTGVENRIPVGVDTTFPASTQRVYVWSQIEARQFPTKIRHIYYFNGWKANDIALDVRSSTWRTWSFKTISNDRYKGQWRVDITSEGGKILRRLHFEIN
jgi:hypothetical protein